MYAAEMNEESILKPEIAKNIACHFGRQVAPGAGAPCPWSCAVTFFDRHLVSPRTHWFARGGLRPARPGWSWPRQKLGVLIHPVRATTLAHGDLSSSSALLLEAIPLEAWEAPWELWHGPSVWLSYVEHVELRAAGAREELGRSRAVIRDVARNFEGSTSCARAA